MTSSDIAARRRWMGVLAKARPPEIDEAWSALGAPSGYVHLRRPETGLAMVRGRMGGDGAAFNVGEMTVTRCSVRLADGAVGHAYVAGRDASHAERAAVIDALFQDEERRASIEALVIAPLERAQAERRDTASRKAAATRVDFFTMIRGET